MPLVFQLCLTGLCAGELFTREDSDVNGQFLKVDKKTDIDWRPKGLSSLCTVAVPTGFKLKSLGKSYQSGTRDLGQYLREFILDPTAPLHSSRHTFLTFSRRADCDTAVVTALTGHHSKETSRVAQSYGLFPDEVLLREAQKVWDYVDTRILKL